MFGQDESSSVDRVLGFLREWDRGSDAARKRMLDSFVRQNSGNSSGDLELHFSHVSSLFLARLSTNLRLTCMFGAYLGLQLRAVEIFLRATDHDQYRREFVEHGGVLTLLDILSLTNIKETDKSHVVKLLLIISNSGPKFSEIICECEGVKAITGYLSESHVTEVQETFNLLESLLLESSKYHQQTCNHLIKLWSCSSEKVQKLVTHCLHTLLGQMASGHNIVQPLLNTLTLMNLDVQEEGKCLHVNTHNLHTSYTRLGFCVFVCLPAAIHQILGSVDLKVRPALLTGLLAQLQPPEDTAEENFENMKGVFMQQATAAKTIRLLCQSSQEVSAELLSLGVVKRLLFLMGNRRHVDSQIQAGLTLKVLYFLPLLAHVTDLELIHSQYFVDSFPVVLTHVSRVMGASLFKAFMHKAEDFCTNMTETEAANLQANEAELVLDVKDSAAVVQQ
ncbi:armadillo-like helical domain containing protein 1 isoform X1 [Synchiropus splendidus]|uniref:armadillo-like helical domain containing protein 1 isoform X1 n=1 Tax=Synchiropus splendidus TaxID=270530 RepID=UPI00237D6706|nr:armadillo-like helical domain containing protein 1 isoform X1 [Synchiropus splendidus]